MPRNTAVRKTFQVRPDAKGRITLGPLAEGISSFRVSQRPEGILLEPMVEIPASESWLFENEEALNRVRRGLADSAKGKTKSRGSFVAHLDDQDE